MEYIIFLLAQSIWWGLMSWKFFVVAGRKQWEAFVPFYNMYVMLKIADRPWWWLILILMPVVGIVMTIVLVYEFLHVFGHRKTWQTAAVMLTVGLYMGYLNYSEPIKYVGRDPKAIKAALGDWGNSIIFAIVAATIIRATTFEAYTIPTSSMEKSLMVGDFLFVSKLHYGVRVPMTPISFPLVHNTFPFTSTKSYFEHPQIPYIRLPKFESISVGDAVVFNWPVDVGPVDKRQNYVKRCVGTPGDTIRIIDRKLYINGELFDFPERSNPQYKYYVSTNGPMINRDVVKNDFDINYLTTIEAKQQNNAQDVESLKQYFQYLGERLGSKQLLAYAKTAKRNEYLITISDSSLTEFSNLEYINSVIPIVHMVPGSKLKDESIPVSLRNYLTIDTLLNHSFFPNYDIHKRQFKQSVDNYSATYIPKKGDKVNLNYENFARFQVLIEKYEGNTLEVRDKAYYINGEKADSYTFKQNYYWMMGDNRHNSLDSRFWGYVPEDHIVGKPVFIWMSYDKYGDGINKIRFDRVFTTVHGNGKRVSYFWYVLVLAILMYVGNKYWKKRKAAKKAA
jgi:signal peptidase I